MTVSRELFEIIMKECSDLGLCRFERPTRTDTIDVPIYREYLLNAVDFIYDKNLIGRLRKVLKKGYRRVHSNIGPASASINGTQPIFELTLWKAHWLGDTPAEAIQGKIAYKCGDIKKDLAFFYVR